MKKDNELCDKTTTRQVMDVMEAVDEQQETSKKTEGFVLLKKDLVFGLLTDPVSDYSCLLRKERTLKMPRTYHCLQFWKIR